MMDCIVCGRTKNVHDAHVKDKSSFDDHGDDRTRNIIPLCGNHHKMFDKGQIGICPDTNRLVMEVDGNICPVKPKHSIENIKCEYIEWQNSRCNMRIRSGLGYLSGDSVCNYDWAVVFEIDEY